MTESAKPVKVVAMITINAAPRAVFEYMVNLKHHFLWNPHLQTISPLTTLKKGSVYKSSSLLLGVKVRGTNKVIKLVINQEMQIENETGVIHYSVNYSLRPVKKQTQVICTTIVKAKHKSLHFAKPVMQVLAKRELQTDLKALKVAVEHQIRSSEV